MKKNSLLLFVLFAFVLNYSISAQKLLSEYLDPMQNNLSLIYGTDDMKGNPFLFEEWMEAELISKEVKPLKVDQLKIDVCSQKVVIKIDGTEKWLNVDNLIALRIFEVPGMPASLYIKSQDDKGKIKFAKVLKEGDYSLLKISTKKFKKPNGSNDYAYGASDVRKPYFSDLDTDYILTYLNDKHEKINLKEKDIKKKVQKKHKKMVEALIKKDKIKVKTEQDMIQLLTVINQKVNEKEVK